MNTLLVNLYGAPCSGKSVKMMQLAVVAKLRRVYCEIAAEVAKEYIVQNIPITRDVQWALSREQVRRLHCFVGHVEAVITDAPVLIGQFYTHYRQQPGREEFDQAFAEFDAQLRVKAGRVVNVYLWRNHPYNEAGRIETEAEDGQIAQQMWAFVQEKLAGQILLQARSTDSPEALWDAITHA